MMMPANGRKNEYQRRVSPIVRSGGRSRLTHMATMKLKKSSRPTAVSREADRDLPFHAVQAPAIQRSTEGAAKYMKWFQDMLFDLKDEDGEKKEANLFFTLSAVNADEHMNNIAQLSNIFMNDDLLDALAAAKTPEDILKAEADFPCEED